MTVTYHISASKNNAYIETDNRIQWETIKSEFFSFCEDYNDFFHFAAEFGDWCDQGTRAIDFSFEPPAMYDYLKIRLAIIFDKDINIRDDRENPEVIKERITVIDAQLAKINYKHRSTKRNMLNSEKKRLQEYLND